MKRKDANERRQVHLTVACSADECAAIQALWGESTSRSLSEYARKVLLKRPVAVTYRNVSLDALIAELNALRDQLERQMACNPGQVELELIKNILQTVTQIANQITEQCIQQ